MNIVFNEYSLEIGIRAGLLSAKLSQTAQTVHVTRASARSLGSDQWKLLEKRLLAWRTGLAGVLEVDEAGEIGAEEKPKGALKFPRGSDKGLASRKLPDGESTGLSFRPEKDGDEVPIIGRETVRCIDGAVEGPDGPKFI